MHSFEVDLESSETKLDVEIDVDDSYNLEVVVEASKSQFLNSQGLKWSEALANHISSPNPHRVYDDMPDLSVIFNNSLSKGES